MADFVACFSEESQEKFLLNANAIKAIKYENSVGLLAEGFNGEIYHIYNSYNGFDLRFYMEDFPDVDKFRKCFIHT